MMIVKFDGVNLMFWSFIESIDGVNLKTMRTLTAEKELPYTDRHINK